MEVGAWILFAVLMIFRVAFFLGLLYVMFIVLRSLKGALSAGRPVEAEAASSLVPELRKAGPMDQ